MENCPAPVVSVSPGRAPLDQQLHDLSVGAGGRQVKRGLVWGASSGVRVSTLLKLLFKVREPGAWAGPAPQQGPGQVSAAQRHSQVQRGQGVHVTLVQGEVILEHMMPDARSDLIESSIPQLMFPIFLNYYQELLDELHRPLLSRYPPLLRLMLLH